MAIASYILSFLICLTFSSIVLSDYCTYTISVKTGTESHAGTDAVVSLKFSDLMETPIDIPVLENYGVMEKGHDYFENGNLDIFKYTGSCFSTYPICFMKLSHNNGGEHSGWYVDYVEIETHGGQTKYPKQHFLVGQWLAYDEQPYKITTCRERCALYPWAEPEEGQEGRPTFLARKN
ncbi:PLAT domain-containing protein 2-like [Mercurialis annua]|uniref:PLAT domain-containing protein 2-like n=1 Tax=Mercurialis annua TaxID=3986 RepID=UPI00215EC30F|nr:PLAT domain-containing protein 2-like [Mercurialis annua]